VFGATVTNDGGCATSDFISVGLISAPEINLIKKTRYLCGTTPVSVSVSNTGSVSWYSASGLVSSTREAVLNSAGKFWVKVNGNGCSATDSIRLIPTNNIITAGFLASTLDTLNQPVQFVNVSDPVPVSQFWEFGDGITSSEFSPFHAFLTPADFSVTLHVSNGYCEDRITKSLNVLFRNRLQSSQRKLEVMECVAFPNPFSARVNLRLLLNDKADIELSILDLSGRSLLELNTKNIIVLEQELVLDGLANGIYLLSAISRSGKGTVSNMIKLIKAE
jgi:hypothetical protein